MKNRKFIGENLESCGWDIETYNSQLFDGNPMFWAEFSYTDGFNTFVMDLKKSMKLAEELTKFINEATKKEGEFNEQKKKSLELQYRRPGRKAKK